MVFHSLRPETISARRALAGLLMGCILGSGSWQLFANELGSSTHETSQWLLVLAKQWVAEHEGLRPSEVDFLPLDARLDLRKCLVETPQIDLPFGSNKTLRLQCGKEGQQVFLHRKYASNTVTGSKASIHYGKPTSKSESVLETKVLSQPELSDPKTLTATSRAGLSEQTVLVAATTILANQPLQTSLFRPEKKEVFGNPKQFVLSPSELPFLELLKPLKPGEVLKQRDTRRARLVRKGTPVQYQFISSPHIRLQIELQAMEDGFFGDKIRLKNPESGRIIMGLVMNRGEAQSF
jgi:flagella basal body P-ring formation protein FlgA